MQNIRAQAYKEPLTNMFAMQNCFPTVSDWVSRVSEYLQELIFIANVTFRWIFEQSLSEEKTRRNLTRFLSKKCEKQREISFNLTLLFSLYCR